MLFCSQIISFVVSDFAPLIPPISKHTKRKLPFRLWKVNYKVQLSANATDTCLQSHVSVVQTLLTEALLDTSYQRIKTLRCEVNRTFFHVGKLKQTAIAVKFVEKFLKMVYKQLIQDRNTIIKNRTDKSEVIHILLSSIVIRLSFRGSRQKVKRPFSFSFSWIYLQSYSHRNTFKLCSLEHLPTIATPSLGTTIRATRQGSIQYLNQSERYRSEKRYGYTSLD